MSDGDYRAKYNKSYALLVGIDTYANCSPLSTAARGATDLAQILKSDYGFTVTVKTNDEVTRRSLFQWLNTIRRKAQTNVRILIYYAGHGMTRGSGSGVLSLVEQ